MDWFKHDVNCLADDRLSALIMEHGPLGYAVYFHAIEAMYSNQGNPINGLSIKRIAKDFVIPTEQVVTILDYAASEECEHLLIKRPEGYVSERVLEACEENEQFVNKRSEAGKKGNEIRWQAHRNVIANVSQSNRNVITNVSQDNRTSSQKREEKKREDKNKNISGEVSEESLPSDEVVIDLPTNKAGTNFPVTEPMVQELTSLYPAVDVNQELRKMKGWLIGNPSLRKTYKGMMRFITSWLAKHQDRSTTPSPGKDYKSRHMVTDDSERSIGVDENGIADLRELRKLV